MVMAGDVSISGTCFIFFSFQMAKTAAKYPSFLFPALGRGTTGDAAHASCCAFGNSHIVRA